MDTQLVLAIVDGPRPDAQDLGELLTFGSFPTLEAADIAEWMTQAGVGSDDALWVAVSFGSIETSHPVRVVEVTEAEARRFEAFDANQGV